MLPETLPATVGAYVAVKEILPPAFTVAGKVKPLRLNPAPEAVACEIVKLVLPELESVIVSELLLFTSTLPKLRLLGLAPSCPCTPVPLNPIVIGESEALLVKATLPLKLPADVGTKVTANEVLAPAFRVTGKLKPAKLNPLPEALACEIVRLAPPEFESVMVCELLPFTETLPKLKFAGLAASWPCIPVPVSDTDSGEFEALLVTDKVALAPPADLGAN
jgi:hypothetical protein